MSQKRKLKRGAVRVSSSTFVGVFLPLPLVELLDRAVLREDTDRSKYFRSALREKLEGSR
ncbi:MAG: hypothetical protein ABMA01_22680 [Chthoniobacteraceae bacterium]